MAARSNGRAGVPMKASTQRVSSRPSVVVMVTVLGTSPWPQFPGAGRTVTRRHRERMAGSLSAFSPNEAGSRGSR